MWRSIASNALSVLVVVVFLLGGALIWAQGMYANPGVLAQATCVKVERGTNMRALAHKLENQGIITNVDGLLMRLGADYSGKAPLLKHGEFLVTGEASISDLVDIVTSSGASTCGTEIVYRLGITRATVQVRELEPETGRYAERATFDPAEDTAPEVYERLKAEPGTRFRIALAEGVTSWQVVQELNQIDILTGEIEGIPPEGYLAPDSYEVRAGDSRADLVARMADAQAQILAEAWATRAPGLPLANAREALVLASIVEKETALAEERPQVASVFINRLDRGMRLQTDPTVIYGITRGQGTLGRGLRRSELRADTPWNTYTNAGLPPTPIANPGRASIEAVLNPAQTEYIFFVADGTGGHAFAVTLEEHNRNVARWRQIEAEQN